MLVRFARCCNPLPGDAIVGYITRGRGVSVHRADCINLKDAGVEPERMIEVEWESSGAGSYEADIQMLCYDHAGLFAEISLMFASQDVPVTAVTAHTVKNKQGLCTMNMTIVFKTTQQLDKLLRDLQKRPTSSQCSGWRGETMRLVVQRVTRASVTVEERVVGKIGRGYMVLVEPKWAIRRPTRACARTSWPDAACLWTTRAR